MRIIGVTGPTGAGKSLFSKILSERAIPTIDADRVYHDMLLPPSECLDAIRSAFGDSVFAHDGSLDRKMLGEVVFSDPEKLELLNSTVLTRVIAKIKKMIREYESRGFDSVAVDAPTLIESGFNAECSCVISVLAPKELRAQRIVERDAISADTAELRISAQKDDSFYIEHSDYVLYNNENYESFKSDALSLFARLGLS